MEYTKNYNLKKPAPEEVYNIGDFNSNADVIDRELKNLAKAIDGKIMLVDAVPDPATVPDGTLVGVYEE